MRSQLALLLVASFANIASAAIDNKDMPFVTLCVDEHTIGLGWQNGAWTGYSFPPERRIVEKVLPIADDVCAFEMMGKAKEYEDMLSLGTSFGLGCYNLRPEGANYRPIDTKVCFENWSDDGMLQRIDCSDSYESFSLAPDGDFNRSRITGVQAGPVPETRPPLMVAAGRCAVVSRH